MKILCETNTIFRDTQTRRTSRLVKATLGIGYHRSARDANENSTKQVEIIHFTPQNKVGQRYKVVGNIVKIFTRFVEDGKATISFREPPVDIMIKCDPIQLKAFLQTLKFGLEGKETDNLRLNIASATAIPNKSRPVENLTVLNRSDYPTKGFPKTLKKLIISGIELHKITFEVCSLRNLTSLNLSYNNVTKIPAQLGQLSLVEFHISTNAVGETNDWAWLDGKNLRNSLRDLDLSANKLTYFPPKLIKLEQLVTLKLNDNTIKSIPFGVRRMRSLRILQLSSNQLKSLPSSFNSISLDLLDVWGNKFLQPNITEDKPPQRLIETAEIPPLWLIAARAVGRYKLPYSPQTLPLLLCDMLSELPKCACGKLCYNSPILKRAALATFDNVKNFVFSRNRLIYADVVLCGPSCSGRKQLLNAVVVEIRRLENV